MNKLRCQTAKKGQTFTIKACEFMKAISKECKICGCQETTTVSCIRQDLPFTIENAVPTCKTCSDHLQDKSVEEYRYHCMRVLSKDLEGILEDTNLFDT